MKLNIVKALSVLVLLASVLVSGCRTSPPTPPITPSPGIVESKQVLIADAKKQINTEAEANSLVQANLKAVSDADLFRIAGPIDWNTMITISAEKQENTGGEDTFAVNIDYDYKESKMAGDIGKLTVIVTGSGKIYGNGPIK